MDGVSLDDDIRPAVDVDAVGRIGISVVWIAKRGDVVDGVTGYRAVTRTIIGGLRRGPLVADRIDSDIVVVMDQVAGHGEALDVAVQCQGLTAAGLIVIHLVAADGEIVD